MFFFPDSHSCLGDERCLGFCNITSRNQKRRSSDDHSRGCRASGAAGGVRASQEEGTGAGASPPGFLSVRHANTLKTFRECHRTIPGTRLVFLKVSWAKVLIILSKLRASRLPECFPPTIALCSSTGAGLALETCSTTCEQNPH